MAADTKWLDGAPFVVTAVSAEALGLGRWLDGVPFVGYPAPPPPPPPPVTLTRPAAALVGCM